MCNACIFRGGKINKQQPTPPMTDLGGEESRQTLVAHAGKVNARSLSSEISIHGGNRAKENRATLCSTAVTGEQE